jgi:hypothetical protein
VHSPEEGAPEVMSPKGVPKPEENALVLEPLPFISNSLFIYKLFSCFIKKKYFHGNVGTYEIG